MRHLILLAVAAAALPGLACSGDNPFSPSDVVGVTWRLTSVQIPGLDPIIVDESDNYTLRFDQDGTLHVNFDCGSCTGQYVLDDEDLEIDDVACNADACGIGALDPQIAQALEAVQTIDIDVNDDEMTLMGNGVTLRFEQ